MRDLLRKNSVSWLIIGGFFAVISAYVVHLLVSFFLSRPPVIVLSVKVDAQTVVSGKPVTFRYLLDRRRRCPAEVSPYWSNRNGLIRLPPYPGGLSPIGKSEMVIHAPTFGRDAFGEVFSLSPGQWEYATVSRHWCGDTVITQTTKPVTVTVVERRD